MEVIIMDLFNGGLLDFFVLLGRPFFSALIIYYFMSKLLPNRLNTYSLIILSLVIALWYNLRKPGLYGTAYHLWMNIAINLWTAFIVLGLFRGKLWQRIIIYWYYDIIKTLCEAIAYTPILLYYSRMNSYVEWEEILSTIELSVMMKLIYLGFFLSSFILLGFLSLKIWKKLLMHKFQLFYLLYLILPLGQTYSLALVIHPNMGDIFFGIAIKFTNDIELLYYFFALFGVLLSLTANLVLLVYTISQEKRKALEKELHQLQHQLKLEQTHYNELEQRQEALAKIRHDFNNQLASISQLVRSGDHNSAREMIDSLAKEINNTYNQ